MTPGSSTSASRSGRRYIAGAEGTQPDAFPASEGDMDDRVRAGVGRASGWEEALVSHADSRSSLSTYTGVLSVPPARLNQVPSSPQVTPNSPRDLSLPGTPTSGQEASPPPLDRELLVQPLGCWKGEGDLRPLLPCDASFLYRRAGFSILGVPARSVSCRIQPPERPAELNLKSSLSWEPGTGQKVL